MGILYVGAALVIILMNYDKIGWAFGQIFAGAFTGLGVAGGFVGALIQGFKRAAFSNEAGVGSAAIAHSAVRTKEPITEGFVSLLEPFIDTVVICTMTALVIIITQSADLRSGNRHLHAERGAARRSPPSGQLRRCADIGGLRVGDQLVPYVLAIAVVLFAFSTMISLVLLRPEGVDLPVRRRQDQGTGVQDHLLRLRGHRCGGQPRPGHRLLRCGDLCHGGGQHHRALSANADRQARDG
jgi:Na+/alanine symporter